MKLKLLIFLLCFYMFSQSVLAGGVGYINYEKVIENYQYAKNTLTEIENKQREVQIFLKQKENEFNKIDSAVKKKNFEEEVRKELLTREKAFNSFREKREDEIYSRIHAVSEKIRMEKGLDAVLDARSVFSGGVDITDDLIKKLNQ